MFTWWGLYKSVPYELVFKALDGDRNTDRSTPVVDGPEKTPAAESAWRGGQGEVHGSRVDA